MYVRISKVGTDSEADRGAVAVESCLAVSARVLYDRTDSTLSNLVSQIEKKNRKRMDSLWMLNVDAHNHQLSLDFFSEHQTSSRRRFEERTRLFIT